MPRKILRKIVPQYAIFPMLLTAISMLCSYQAAKLLQTIFDFSHAIDLTTTFDQLTPFVPGWSLVYIGSYFFWFYVYTTAARDSVQTVCRLAVADIFGKLVSLIFFLALPTTNVRPETDGTGLTMFLMRTIYQLDTPTNLFPSMHCFIAWLGTRYILTAKNLPHKWLHRIIAFLGSLAIFASTLFTKQHVIWDVFGAILIAETGMLIARFPPLSIHIEKWNQKFMQTSLCKFL